MTSVSIPAPANRRLHEEDDMTTTLEEGRIRQRIGSWAEALRRKDVDGVLSHYTADALSFDLAPPLQHGRDAVRRGLTEWFPTWKGSIGYEITDLRITVGDDVAFTHSLNHLTGTRTNGDTSDVWFRATVCLRREHGEWRVAHEHTSVPFYMDGSFRAAVDLRP
jgi:PhnB protein